MSNGEGRVYRIDNTFKMMTEVRPIGGIPTKLLAKSPGKCGEKIPLFILGFLLYLLCNVKFIILDSTSFLRTLHFFREKFLIAVRDIIVLSQMLFSQGKQFPHLVTLVFIPS